MPGLQAGQEWAKVGVRADGLVVVTSADLLAAGFNVNGIDPATLQVFGLGGRELPEIMDSSTGKSLRELAIQVYTDGAGKFDRLMFYGRSTLTWQYASTSQSFSHTLHHYDTTSSYVITYGAHQGKRVLPASTSGSATIIPDRFTDRLVREQDSVNAFMVGGGTGSGRDWFMAQVNPGASQRYSVFLPGYAGGAVTCRTSLGGRFYGATGQTQSIDVLVADSVLGTVIIPNSYGDVSLFRVHNSFRVPQSRIAADSRTTLQFSYNSSAPTGMGAIDYFEVEYPRFFQAAGNVLHVWAPDTAGTIRYSLKGFSEQPLVWDVTDDANAQAVTVLGFSGGIATVDLDAIPGTARELIAAVPSAAQAPSSVHKIEWPGLRDLSWRIKYVVITDPALFPAAKRLADFRAKEFGAVAVTTDQIYNEFSGGMRDVTAIRDFLHYAFVAGGNTLRYALLLGDGSYDYKHDPTNLVPAYETSDGDSFDGIVSRATDDYFGCVAGNDAYVDLGVGRICVRSADEADAAVNKIISYETESEKNDWRNLVTVVADDNNRGSEEGADGVVFTADAEELLRYYVPASFDIRKIYLAQYTTVFSGLNNTGGRTKPGAYDDIIDAFNSGTLMLNWIGHGNPHVWAHEQVFVNESSIPQLHNQHKLAFLTAATCDFGRFDNPLQQSGTEGLTLKPDGGTIGVLSTSRSVYDAYNVQVNEEFYTDILTQRDGDLPLTLGDAMFRTKQHRFDPTWVNDQKFYLQGDPGLRLRMPTAPVVVQHVNEVDVTTTVAQLKALQRVHLDGTIHRPDSAKTLWSTFDGVADVSVFDSERQLAVASGADTFRFAQPGGLLYRGQSTVRNGAFSANFIVPRDISYENKQGKISVYAVTSDGLDAVGSNSNIIVGGTDTSVHADAQGPTIKLYLDSRTFHTGDLVSAEPLLIVDLADSSGINASGSAIGHRIEAWIDSAVTSADLTPEYRSALDNPARGSAERTLLDLAPGTHSARVRAWDVFNNPSEAVTTFVIPTSGAGIVIEHVMPVPNPFAGSTTFTLQHNQQGPVNVEIKIYTVAGRLLQTLSQQGIQQHLVTIPWDGKDRDGGALGNGVYLYRVIVKTADGSQQVEQVDRLAVLR